MRHKNIYSGLTYIALGAALLSSGPLVDEQLQALAANPGIQMARALYTTTLRELTTIQKPIEVQAAATSRGRVIVVKTKDKNCKSAQL